MHHCERRCRPARPSNNATVHGFGVGLRDENQRSFTCRRLGEDRTWLALTLTFQPDPSAGMGAIAVATSRARPDCPSMLYSNTDASKEERSVFEISRTSIVIFYLSLLTLSMSAPELAQARGGFNPNCRVPSIRLCPDCSVIVKITVLQNHECRINYGSLGPMRAQKILVNPTRGRYWAYNETRTAYSPNKGFLGSDYLETRFFYELMNGSMASARLKASIEVVPHL